MRYMWGTILLLSDQFIENAALASSSSENIIQDSGYTQKVRLSQQLNYHTDYIIVYTPVGCLQLSGTNLLAVPPAGSARTKIACRAFHVATPTLLN